MVFDRLDPAAAPLDLLVSDLDILPDGILGRARDNLRALGAVPVLKGVCPYRAVNVRVRDVIPEPVQTLPATV